MQIKKYLMGIQILEKSLKKYVTQKLQSTSLNFW